MSRELTGTQHAPRATAKLLGQLAEDQTITTTWILNKNLAGDGLISCTRDVVRHCEKHGLKVMPDYPYHLKVTGSAVGYKAALQVNMAEYQDDEIVYHASATPIKVPVEWEGKIVNILGLDNCKVAHPYFHKADTLSRALITFNPLQLATLYKFPTGLDGTGQKVGIIELGGGYVQSDLTTYFTQLGIPGTPNVTAVSVDGATNSPNDGSGANLESVLDIEVIAAIAPKAAIFVYYGPNSYQGFYNAINRAINDGCNIVSISWGAAESGWTSGNLSTYNSLFQSAANQGVTILAAAGDNGSTDGTNANTVDFPASSPYVVACGGTKLQTVNDVDISSEVVWNNNSTSSATGGGISKVFARPGYQSSLTYSLGGKRGVPDVSGVADPNTGYVLYSAEYGGWVVVGGTSGVSPLWSGLLSRINQSIGHNVGFFQPFVYANPGVCRDVTQGNNGGYSASSGWDPCTGIGSPNGQLLLSALANGVAPVASFTGTPLSGNRPLTVNFTDTSTNVPTSWSWNFGDNTTSTVTNPSKVYNTAGTFTVTLTTTNGNGSSTATQTNYITVTNPPTPVASFTASPLTGTRPLAVNFTDTSTNSPTSWSWNFGDNTSSTSRNPSKSYTNAGTYTVGLTATNGSGSNTMTKTNYITVNNPPVPVVSFTGTPTSGRRSLTVRFTDNSTNSPNSWSWNFGDGTSSSLKNPTKVYSRTGIYSVRLTASNSSGSGTLTRSGYIRVT